MRITKISGEVKEFSRAKLQRSLIKSGASRKLAEEISRTIERELVDGATTKEVYQRAFQLLKKEAKPLAARYSLKKSIFQLGPEGYPFERFIGRLLRGQGYSVKVGVVVQGACVSHEIDVIAEKDGEHFLVEAKFHNRQGVKSDVQTALYVKARFDDIQSRRRAVGEHEGVFHQMWLVTNTKFTNQAIAYAKCMNMRIIGWNYPENNGLEDIIEKSGLHPLTCLTTLSAAQKKALLDKDIILCREVHARILEDIGVDKRARNRIVNEISSVCSL